VVTWSELEQHCRSAADRLMTQWQLHAPPPYEVAEPRALEHEILGACLSFLANPVGELNVADTVKPWLIARLLYAAQRCHALAGTPEDIGVQPPGADAMRSLLLAAWQTRPRDLWRG
jgi:hypothetical protein